MRILTITPGDPDGIGPEITWRAIQAQHGRRDTILICVGARAPFDKLGAPVVTLPPAPTRAELEARALATGATPAVLMIEAPLAAPAQSPRAAPAKAREPHWRRPAGGKFSVPGFQSGWSITRATELVRAGVADAIVTGPISKERLQAGGYAFPGHTEFLAALCRVRDVTMMLANDQLRVSLVTTHIALKDVPRALDRRGLRRAILHTAEHLVRDLGIAAPRIAVAGLNPHAGEGGLFGREEQRVITPEIHALQRSSGRKHALPGATTVHGPLPADTLFAKHVMGDRYDAIVCLYHDQGLIPVKLLDFPRTVNVSLGLPIVRTSVDHGVAFDIAGTGKADPSSLISAIGLAEKIVDRRRTSAAES